MDMTSFTFSGDDDSLATQSLRDKIGLISRQLVFDSPSSLNQAMNITPSHSPVTRVQTPSKTTGACRGLFSWSDSFYSPRQSHSSSTILNRTVVLPPPETFRDIGDAAHEQDEPFDLSVGAALDLRIQPLALTKETEQLKSTKTSERALSDVSAAQTDNSLSENGVDMTSSSLNSTSTCTSLDKTYQYPVRHIGISTDEEHSVRRNCPSGIERTKNSLEDFMNNRKTEPLRKQKIATRMNDGQETMLSSEADDKVSTSVLIDNAFHYLTELPDENTILSSERHRDLNQTYICQPVVWDKPPSGRNCTPCTLKRASASNIVGRDENSRDDKETSEQSLSDSSSFTSVTNIGSDTTSVWSVKAAVTSLSSSLTMTLTKTPSVSSSSLNLDSTADCRLTPSKPAPQVSICSIPKNRVVVGCNTSQENSAVASDASQTETSNKALTFVSFPATPDISFCEASDNNSAYSTAKSKGKMLSSTPRKVREEPIGNVTTSPTFESESLRIKILKKATTQKQDTDESDLNLAFTSEFAKPSPVKRKKKSLIKALKKQLMCNNARNVSSLSHHDQTVTATCMDGVFKIPKTPHRSKSSNHGFMIKKAHSSKFPVCTSSNNSGTSVSFATLNRSSNSTPISAWCQQIISTTANIIPNTATRPLSAPMDTSTAMTSTKLSRNKSASKSVGMSTTSLPSTSPGNKDNSFQKNRQQTVNAFESTAFSCDLSQINPCNTHAKDLTHALSTTSVIAQGPSKEKLQKSKSKTSLTSVGSNTDAGDPTWLLQESHPYNPLTFDPQQVKQVNQWMALSNYHTQLDLISRVGRTTAEWLATFVNDKDMKIFQSRFDLQPNRNVLFELCDMCNIKIRVSDVDPAILTLKKTSHSRAPSETDVKRLIRSIRR